jgi:pyruvate/2-oxoglutarate dehydrogenase complex dihydrolipoamide acyltransferase (E2) component
MSVELRLAELDGAGEMSGGRVEEAEVARLLVADGAQVEAGQEVIEVVGDKATVALAAPAAGVLLWHVEEGDLVVAGAVLATIEGGG